MPALDHTFRLYVPVKGEGGAVLPDMVEVVRFTAEAGCGPGLVVLRRKISGPLQARLRHVTAELSDEA